MLNQPIQDEKKAASIGMIVVICLVGSFVSRFFEKLGWLSFSESFVLFIAVAVIVNFWLDPTSPENLVKERTRLILIGGLGFILSLILNRLLSGFLPTAVSGGLMIFFFLTLCYWLKPQRAISLSPELGKHLIKSSLFAIGLGVMMHILDFQ